MKKSGRFGVFKLLSLCLIVAIVSAVPTIAMLKNKTEGLEQNLKGNVSEFQGILTIWNVDTFESGSQSKTVFLEEVSRNFSAANQGLYFLIKNLSVEEMTSNFMNGIFPDIISFGAGIGDVIEPKLEALNNLNFSGLRNEVLESGKSGEIIKAAGYLMGGYILSSTNEKLIDAGVDSNQKLSNILNSAGFDRETRKGNVHTASVLYGENVFIKPETVSEIAFGLSLQDKCVSPTMYDAYVDFVGYNKGTILLGTHRDLFKLSGRVKVGKISGVKLEYVKNYTNLMQYAGVIKSGDDVRMSLSKKFVEYLVSIESQQLSAKIGMVNVVGGSFYEDGEFKDLENALSNKLIIPKVFS